MSTYNALLRQIRAALEAKLATDFDWQPEAIKGMRNVTRGRRSQQNFFTTKFKVGEPVTNDGKAVPEFPFLTVEAFDYPQEDSQPGDVRVYCAPLPEARQMLEQALAGGPYEGCCFIRFDVSRAEGSSHAPGGQNLSEEAFVDALAQEWSQLHALMHPEDGEIDDGSDEEQTCPDCGITSRMYFDSDPDDPENEIEWKEPRHCAGCGKPIPIEVAGEAVP